jgi:hypothetical protein
MTDAIVLSAYDGILIYDGLSFAAYKSYACRYNRGMNNLDILIPFGLPPAEMARDLLRALSTPSYASLLARSKSLSVTDLDAFARALPHETWLAQRFGLPVNDSAGSPPLAWPVMHQLGMSAEAGHWFMLQPAHLHVARDHLVLTDLRRLVLTEDESRILFQSIKELFAESGKTLVYGDARTWFLRADDWAELSTSTPGAAGGHNIDIWMPRGPKEREWRKLLNEVQMTWHAHPVNAQREALGLPALNSLWLWGGSREDAVGGKSPYQQIFNPLPWMHVTGDMRKSGATVTDVLDSSVPNGLVVLDGLMDAAMASDWSNWLDAMHHLESEWMSHLLDALRNGKIGEIRFILTHNSKLMEVATGKNSVKKFWIKPSLSPLSR